MTAATIAPEPGQVWADNNPRAAGRTLLITKAPSPESPDHVASTIVTNSKLTERLMPSGDARDTRGRTTQLKVTRLRPTRTGYRLIGTVTIRLDDVTATTPQGARVLFGDVEAAARWLLAQDAEQ